LAHPHHSTALVNGVSIPAIDVRHDPGRYQELLRDAKRTHGHALCQCAATALKLVIRERAGRLFLAAWPDQAASHSLGCAFYSDTLTSTRSKYTPTAVQSDDHGHTLGLHHPFERVVGSVEAGRTGQEQKREGSNTARALPREKLHLWGVLHYLWDESGLNRWHPSWQRDWGFARHVLRRVAQSTMVNGEELLSNLYIPPVWREGERESIRHHWAHFVQPLQQHHRRSPTVKNRLILGVVKSLDVSEFGFVLHFKHHAEAMYIPTNVAETMQTYSRAGWSALRNLVPTPAVKCTVVAALRLEATINGRMSVTEGCLMRTSQKLIPVSSTLEATVADMLVEQKRHFIRPLHYDIQHAKQPCFIVKDAKTSHGHVGVGLYVYGSAVNDQMYSRQMRENMRICEESSLDYYGIRASMGSDRVVLPPRNMCFV
jgi:Protein of unknown function (DUF1173)